MPTPTTELRLGSLALQPRRQLLDHGRPIVIGRKALDILSVLAEANGALVTKDELMAAVWPGLIVEENALQVHVTALRKALGDEAGRLSTVRGLGYRLQITEPQEAAVPAGPETDRAGSLAVLPFANLTGDSAREYLSDGLASELIATLARSSDLRIPSWTSSCAYKNRGLDLRQIGRELGVAFVLEGEVKAGAGRIRVHAQLIDVATGFHRWADSFDRHTSDLLELQEELAEAISSALRAHLGPVRRASVSAEAFDLYLKARALENSPSPANLRTAAELYRSALAIDGEFALALARLGAVLCLGMASSAFALDVLPEARRSAERAVALDPTLPVAHAALASASLRQADWAQAEASHNKAMACGPDSPALIAYGSFLAAAGYLSAARAKLELACQLEPSNTLASLSCAAFHSMAGDDQAYASRAEVAIALGASPDDLPISSVRAIHALREGDHVRAANLWVRGMPASLVAAGYEDVTRQVFAGIVSRASRAAGIAALDSFWHSPQIQDLAGRRSAVAGNIMSFHTWIGNPDGAYCIADHFVRQLNETGRLDEPGARLIWVEHMEPFRNDPRFGSYLEALGLVAFWRRNGWPDLWSPAGSKPLAELVSRWNLAD